jgi:hypothetical protein
LNTAAIAGRGKGIIRGWNIGGCVSGRNTTLCKRVQPKAIDGQSNHAYTGWHCLFHLVKNQEQQVTDFWADCQRK